MNDLDEIIAILRSDMRRATRRTNIAAFAQGLIAIPLLILILIALASWS